MEKVTRREFLTTGVAATAGGMAPRAAPRGLPPVASIDRRMFFSSCPTSTRGRPLGLRAIGGPHTHLDALARSGVRFDDAYCTCRCASPRGLRSSPVCKHHHQAYNNAQPWPFSVKTLAHYLDRAGYMTGVIGKMHFVDAQTHGFDYKLDFDDRHQYLGPKSKLVAEEIIDPNSDWGFPRSTTCGASRAILGRDLSRATTGKAIHRSAAFQRWRKKITSRPS